MSMIWRWCLRAFATSAINSLCGIVDESAPTTAASKDGLREPAHRAAGVGAAIVRAGSVGAAFVGAASAAMGARDKIRPDLKLHRIPPRQHRTGHQLDLMK